MGLFPFPPASYYKMMTETAKAQDSIVLSWLPAEDYGLLRKQFAEWGVPTLDPHLSAVLVAIDTEQKELAGFFVAQTVVHLEPMWISERYRQTGLWRRMAEEAERPFREAGSGFYVFIPRDRPDIEHMAREFGMKVRDWKVAEKNFGSGEEE